MKLRYFFRYVRPEECRLPPSPEVSLRNCDYYPGTRFLPMPAVAVLCRRIEIDRVLGPKLEFLTSNLGPGPFRVRVTIH